MDRFSNKSSENEWLPISDLMSVLMMVFIIISVFYMLQVKKDKDQIEKIAVTFDRLQKELYEDLNIEFEKDLKKWNAEIDSTKLSIRFLAPEQYKTGSPKIFFNPGSSKITSYGKSILKEFFPRFRKIIYSEKYKNTVEEVRIEGHTSSDWFGLNDNRAYYKNMELSQNRTRNVLEFTLESVNDFEEKAWFREYLSSNGLSSSKVIKDSLGKENYNASRRVEFRVKTKAEESILKIVNSK
tara:strand:- start:54 stop:773 length:720 start_codon:yes stop_codon:yes gene_type:complete